MRCVVSVGAAFGFAVDVLGVAHEADDTLHICHADDKPLSTPPFPEVFADAILNVTDDFVAVGFVFIHAVKAIKVCR